MFALTHPAAKGAVLAGALVLVHSALVMINHHDELKMTDQTFDGPPAQVIVECILGSLVCMWGGLKMQGQLLPIKSEMSARSVAGLVFNADLASMNTRTKVMPVNVAPL